MDRKDLRHSGNGYSIQIKQINGINEDELSHQSIDLENISKGGFRFTTNIDFELEDRIKVMLHFPDNTVKEVLGRICYSEVNEPDEKSAIDKSYGFSILLGFYELPT